MLTAGVRMRGEHTSGTCMGHNAGAMHAVPMQVPRRIKVLPPDTPYFSIRRSIQPGKDEGSKIAAGMEIAFSVAFRPESTEDYAYNLVSTEAFYVMCVSRSTRLRVLGYGTEATGFTCACVLVPSVIDVSWAP
jgi:hypothetical protein